MASPPNALTPVPGPPQRWTGPGERHLPKPYSELRLTTHDDRPQPQGRLAFCPTKNTPTFEEITFLESWSVKKGGRTDGPIRGIRVGPTEVVNPPPHLQVPGVMWR